MENFSLNDKTQIEIMRHLEDTEKLLSIVSSKLSKKECSSKIYTMPDLGISSNVTRMAGGFFTGMCAIWETNVSFIPIDATVNSCGVICYKLNRNININQLKYAIEYVKKNTKYDFNYDRGNHFVILAYDTKNPDEQYIFLHASAAEFKNNLLYGLYPVKGNWFYDRIETEKLCNGRYLRYIKGDIAKRFFKISKYLDEYNKKRNRDFSLSILDKCDSTGIEVLNVSHYGMPDINSVCIGCQWKDEIYTLLTANKQDIYIIKPKITTNNTINHSGKKLTLSPHGLGVQLLNDNVQIRLENEKVALNNKVFIQDNKVDIGIDAKMRGVGIEQSKLDNMIGQVLLKTPGNILCRLKQIACYNKDGFTVYN